MTALVKYEAARKALAEAKSTDEVRKIRDTAEAMRAYARQAKDKQLEIDAAEIRIRAERRLGEMLAAQRATAGLNTGTAGKGRPKKGGANEEPPKDNRPTLAEAGIDKKLSSRAQKLAAVPEDEFEGELDEWRERVEKEKERVTTRLLSRGSKAKKKGGVVEYETERCPLCGQTMPQHKQKRKMKDV